MELYVVIPGLSAGKQLSRLLPTYTKSSHVDEKPLDSYQGTALNTDRRVTSRESACKEACQELPAV